MIRVCLESDDPRSRKLINLLHLDVIGHVELEHENFLRVAYAFREEDFLVVAADKVASNHCLWLNDNFEYLLV